jgi:transcriptional regulator with XRE-family HTH domain
MSPRSRTFAPHSNSDASVADGEQAVSSKRKKKHSPAKPGTVRSPGAGDDAPAPAPAKKPRLTVLHTTFGGEVRMRRTEVEMTLVELAKLSGLTPNYIGKIERGKVNPALSTISVLATGLGVAAGELLGDVNDLSASAIRVGRLFDQASPEIRKGVLNVLRGAVSLRKRRQ